MVKGVATGLFQKYHSWLVGLTKERSRQGLYDFLAEQYANIPENAKVLTVGAGGETNKLLASSIASTVRLTSVDIDEARKPDVVADICEAPLPANTYDFVVMAEVLEHLHSPHKGLENIYGALKPGGKLILTTPFILPIHDRPYDYFRFTKYGLKLLLRSFRDVNVAERNSYYEAIDVLWVRLLQTRQTKTFFLSLFLVPAIYFIKRPMSLLLTKCFATDSMTTGYVVTATK
jgi:SAM-dependent methyltransferase